jgi:hypothetical protein
VSGEVGDGLFDVAIAFGLLLDPQQQTLFGGHLIDVNALNREVQNDGLSHSTTTQHSTAQHSTTPHHISIAQHSTAQRQ